MVGPLALLLNNLSEQDSGVVDNSSVNDMVKKIGSLLTNSAKTTFGTFVPGRHNKKDTNTNIYHGSTQNVEKRDQNFDVLSANLSLTVLCLNLNRQNL
jgi:hypothetical protein